MAKIKEKVKKETYRDRFLGKLKNNYVNNTRFYYFAIVIMCACSLVVAWLLLVNKGDTATFDDFFQLYGFKQFSIVLVFFVVVLLLSALMCYLKIYNKFGRFIFK